MKSCGPIYRHSTFHVSSWRVWVGTTTSRSLSSFGVNERDYTLNPIAEKAGFAVYECDSSVDNNVPQYPVRRKIESEVAKRTFEHLIIFTDPERKDAGLAVG